MGVKLAVNQNARWAPHFSYIREAVRAGLLGSIDAIHCDVHWDHSWVKGTVFESVRHLILYDFAIHWFDFVRTIMDEAVPRRIFASMAKSATQTIMPALLAQTIIEYESTQVTLIFDGFTRFDHLDRTLVVGSAGAIRSTGPSNRLPTHRNDNVRGLGPATIERLMVSGWISRHDGRVAFSDCRNREPSNSARNNLASLSLCFAAVASAERGEAVRPGSVRQLPVEPG